MILRSAILFLICTTISAQGDEAIIDHDDNDRRHLQQPAEEEEVVFDILTGEQITPSTTSNESPVPAPTPAFLEDGIISGTVYNDANGNGQRDQASSSSSSSQEESPVSEVIVDLFNCNTGAQEGYTTTNSNGYYSLSISEKYLPEDTTSKNCYYIQYTVLDDTDNDDDKTVFTTPPNGETSDIYLGRGETILNVDAGIMQELLGGSNGVFTEWTSYSPTFAPSVSMGTEDEADGASSESTPTLSPTLEQTTTTSPAVEETEAAIDEQDNESMVNLRSSVRLQLSNIDTRMKRDALSLFESVCADFLNSQIKNDSTAVPPLNDLNCNVLRQEIDEQERVRVRRQRHLRSLRLGRFLDESTEPVNDGSTTTTSISSSSLIVRVRVMGHTNKTSSVQEATDVKFRDVLVKTFNDQGTQFTNALKEESASSTESSSETAEYFNAVGTITSVVSSEVIGGASGAQKSSEGNKEGGGNKGVVATIVVCIVIGSVFVIGLITLRKRRRRREQSNQSTETNDDTAGGMSNVGSSSSDSMAISKAFLRSAVPRFNTDSPPCTPPSNITAASSFSPNSMCSYVGSDGEVEIIQDGLDAHPNALIRRDVMAPPGQLGLLVKGNANTIGYGPAVHVIKPGSPMEGLLHVQDRIVAINDVDTREFSAEDIIQVMTDTSGSERKITVLSDQP